MQAPAAQTNKPAGSRLASWLGLALVVLVFADGRQKTLDEDEFAALTLTPDEQQAAHQALAALQGMFRAWPDLRLERDFSALAAWKIQAE